LRRDVAVVRESRAGDGQRAGHEQCSEHVLSLRPFERHGDECWPRQCGPSRPAEKGLHRPPIGLPSPASGGHMEVDRRAFFATLGSAAVINRMPDEEKAEALEHYMTDLLDQQATGNELLVRRGSGDLFGSQPNGPQGPSAGPRALKVLERMPDKPTLVDFFKYRFAPATHVLQSATDAMKKGEKEETILACLLHDVVLNLIKV